ncbi:MAG: hypothetical protein LBK01_02380 [Burkholderiaceae bacterium]|jgi:hypothetical protein|nr:hypothetical protein [Burkholderiaceae bacterium]
MSASKNWIYHPFFAPILFAALGILPLANWLLLDTDTALWIADTVMDDDYLLVAIYSLTMVVLYVCRPRDNNLQQNISFWIFEFLTLVALFRELGFQHWLTTTDSTAFKIRFFLNPANPLSEKIRAGLILLAVFGCLAYLVIRYTRFVIRQFFKRNAVAWTVVTLCCITAIAKFVDRLPDNYRRFTDARLDLFWNVARTSFEEFYEAYIPLCIMIAAIQFARLKIRLEDA